VRIRRLKIALTFAAALAAGPAAAQISGTPIEISGQAGWLHYDTRSLLRDGQAYGGTIGWRFQSMLVLEGTTLFGPARETTPDQLDRNFSYAGVDLRWNLRPAEARVVPFVLTGAGVGQSNAAHLTPEKLQRGAPSIGLGALFNLRGERTWLRLQVRDVWFRERDAFESGHQLAATAGLHLLWGGKSRDADLDGVRDWLDDCPATPIGATVNARGCPTDSDRDSVLDGIDQCADTPVGCRVDRKGCPADADGDGVCDGLDECADTPKGARVDAKGCPNDADGDKVLDGIDQCEGTPEGAEVDEKGCPKDADRDGVADGLDKCPGTAPGVEVDGSGCPTEAARRETELMDTGTIRLSDVRFAEGKSDLLPESQPILDGAGAVLAKWSMLKVEIGGHTDSRGSTAANQRLSEARAKAVRDYLLQRDPTLQATMFTVKGYGASRPVVPNTTDANRARNRRVEFVVLNKDVLKGEIERRMRGEAAPSPAPAPADSTQR
jgi:outer membrane protein OmpA-like peptidoglycan-associated protein